MNNKSFVFSLVVVWLIGSLAFLGVQPVSAAAGDAVQVSGSLVSVDPIAASFIVSTTDGVSLTVLAPAAFDLNSLVVGELVAVRGTENADGSVTADWIGLQLSFTGVVDSIDLPAGSLGISTEGGELLTVFAPQGFDLGGVPLGASVEGLGIWNEDGSLAAQTLEVLVELTGTVVSVDPLANSFVLETEDGTQYIITPPAGFDWTSLQVGDQLELTGALNEDGTLTAESVMGEGAESEQTNDGFYCTQTEKQHPLAVILAEAYQVEAAVLQEWFCQGFGWGQIMLALQTGERSDLDPSVLLASRRGGNGWGQIWHELDEMEEPGEGELPAEEDALQPLEENRRGNSGGNKGHSDGGPQEDDPDGGRPEHPEHPSNPNDQDGDGRPDHANPHKPESHNP
jgi:hypothetical protein